MLQIRSGHESQSWRNRVVHILHLDVMHHANLVLFAHLGCFPGKKSSRINLGGGNSGFLGAWVGMGCLLLVPSLDPPPEAPAFDPCCVIGRSLIFMILTSCGGFGETAFR